MDECEDEELRRAPSEITSTTAPNIDEALGIVMTRARRIQSLVGSYGLKRLSILNNIIV